MGDFEKRMFIFCLVIMISSYMFHRRPDDSTMLAPVSPGPGWPSHEGQTLGRCTQLIQDPGLSHDGGLDRQIAEMYDIQLC
jgi:hypothetical protein